MAAADSHTTGSLLAPDIDELLTEGHPQAAREALLYLLDAEIAEVLEELDPRHRGIALRLLPRDRAADVFPLLPPDHQEELLKSLSSQQLAQIFNEMTPDDRAELFDELPGQLVNKLFALLDPEERRQTQMILGYPPESIGRIMTPNYVRVRPEWTVSQVLEHIRERGKDAETLDTLYVVDHNNRLVAEVRLHDVLLASPEATVESLMNTNVPLLHARDDQEVAVGEFERFDRPVLPVVDSQGELVGLVTFDDVADVAQEEVTEDIQKMAAVQALDDPYLAVPISTLVRKRAVWLAVIFVSETFSATALQFFEHELERAILLALFIPLILSTGGNSGSQGTSLIIRAMAVNEIGLRDWFRVMRREIVCGLLLGLLLGAIGLGRVILWQEVGWANYSQHFMLVALAVAISLVGVVLWGNLIGSMLPFLLRRVGLDPATASAPFVATLVDVTGIVIYFTTAMVILRGTLL
jgi:magnesium transporter